MKNISDLYNKQKDIWKSQNEKYFGITPLSDWSNNEAVTLHLNACADKFWNNGTNEMKDILSSGRCRNIDKMVPGSYELVFDLKNSIICIYGSFEDDILDRNDGSKTVNIKRAPITYIPYPSDICWFIGDTEYVLRITASVNYSLFRRENDIVKYQRSWSYDIENKKFNITNDIDPYDDMTKLNRTFIESIYGDKVTKDNFEDALSKLPEFERNSAAYFKYNHVEEVFDMIRSSKRFANPLSRVPIPINVVKMMTTRQIRSDMVDNGSFNNLVIAKSKIFSLENSRTVIYKSKFNRNFSFSDSENLFDAFKTSTNKSAGRSRLLLDDVVISNGILYREKNNKMLNMYEIVFKNKTFGDNLSVLSVSRFSTNNDAKRIMMTAKLRAQAVPTLGEVDSFTHETPARIVFGDFKGANYGDSIIISRSFAKKLESRITDKRFINNKLKHNIISSKYNVGDMISVSDFNEVIEGSMTLNYRDIILNAIDENSITFSARIPFSVGDKITNLHGSKGIVSFIFEDEDMPALKNDLKNMKAGPMDIIVSGMSVYRRRSLGQMFEAWALASGINDVDNIEDAIFKYRDDMKEFSDSSIITMNGKESIRPCGINMILRLDHDAVSKQSKSYIKTNYARMLKFGEMELLNLASRGANDIISELDIRSVSKHRHSLSKIRDMQRSGILEKSMSDNMRFFNLLKTIGFDIHLSGLQSEELGDLRLLKLQSLLTDELVDLFNEDESEVF